ncbi:MAG: RNA methylase [archaeon GW2011_AR19]|nr:MAG: RNA methylase [archaeon GW2011_AR19]
MKKINPKPEFLEKMKKLLSQADFEKYERIIQEPLLNSIRCNTLKISPEELKKRLEEKGWKISQPWKEHPEIMIVGNELQPGELGRSIEHLLGYYYIQELASMLSIIALAPKQNELILDLCASPGSKTTQMASQMKNTGTIIANDVNIKRIQILASNLERCGVTNTIITRDDGIRLCEKFKLQDLKFDKILLDAPCSGEGTMRSSPKTCLMWNQNTIKSLSKLQKKLFKNAFEILKPNGEIVYSTCTHAPEENEEVVDFALKEFKDKIKIEEIKLPVKCRPGLIEWTSDFAKYPPRSKFEKSERGRELGNKYNEKVKFCARIYPQDNNSEGFFVAKFRRVK